MTTPLFHAQLLGGLTGLSFLLGSTMLFTMPDDEQVYVIDQAQVVTAVPVAPAMVGLLTVDIIEPRLARLGV